MPYVWSLGFKTDVQWCSCRSGSLRHDVVGDGVAVVVAFVVSNVACLFLPKRGNHAMEPSDTSATIPTVT